METNLYHIPSSLPFLDTLAAGLLKQYGREPLVFTNLTVFLPNRRACRGLQDAFLRHTGGKPILLPQIQPLGDVGDEELTFRVMDGKAGDLPQVISSVEQQLLLTTLVERWQGLFRSGERISVPQAAHLAAQLATLLGEVEKEQLSFKDIAGIVPGELSRHWQITLDFLSILIDKWPEILHERGAVDIHILRNTTLSLQAKHWQTNPPKYPVIAAGSTGSIPATAELLKTIAHLPTGKVILPGLDMAMDDEAFAALEQTHPQYGLKTLLAHIGAKRQQVRPWTDVTAAVDRTRLISQVMRPSASIADWQAIEDVRPEDFSGLERITAATLQEEATVIALQMKYILQTPSKTAALITHERGLARRVAACLHQWDVTIDDSAGQELANTPQAVFLRLLAQMVADQGKNPVSLLNALKHPLALGGSSAVVFRGQVRAMETATLRGVCRNEGFAGIYARLRAQKQEPLAAWIKTVEQAVAPFLAMMTAKEAPLHKLLTAHIAAAEALAASAELSGAQRMWQHPAGEQLKEFLDELLASSRRFKPIAPSDYIGLLEALLMGKTYRPAYGTHPRLFILSPIEARMLRFDLVILGGLNEGSWPAGGRADPWMSRPMRDDFGLPLPEKKIGQAAHDFAELFCAPRVVMTRSEKQDGTEMIPSRWLLRLDAVTKILHCEAMVRQTQPWLTWAKMLNVPEAVEPIAPPAPTPPLAARPMQLSVSGIEALIRDPYSIYAKKILKLKALEPIDKDPGALEFGNFVHKALEIFVKEYDTIAASDRYDFLLDQGRTLLEAEAMRPAVVAFWWPRFERIAAWFADHEPQRRQESVRVLAEVKGTYEIACAGGVFTLEARADRLEIGADGALTLIDYKTGTVPSNRDVQAGLSPQMTLQGVIANAGGFGERGDVANLEYWKVSGGREEVAQNSVGSARTITVQDLLAEAEAGLKNLIEGFGNDTTPYMPCPDADNAPKYNDYAHLERVKEWLE